MFFRISGQYRGLYVAEEGLRIEDVEPGAMTVEIKPTQGTRGVTFTSTLESDAPEGFDGAVRGRHLNLAIPALPAEDPNTQRAVRSIRSDLGLATLRVLNTIRWRYGELGRLHPLDDIVFEYSSDGIAWGTIQGALFFRPSLRVSPYLDAENGQEISQFLASGTTEPMGYDLLREAWEARIDNPRSALMLGIAALEIGTKQCLAQLLPDAVTLVPHLRVGVAELLRKHLPAILKHRNGMSAYKPPARLVDQIDKAISARNRIAHGFSEERARGVVMQQTEYLTLEETLLAVEDLLALFDFYAGHIWALERVRGETIEYMSRKRSH